MTATRVRIVGLGQSAAGDDGVGLAIARRLASAGLPPEVEVLEAHDPSELVESVRGVEALLVVDAALSAGPPGQVLVATPEAFEEQGVAPLSSHALSATAALRLGRALHPGEAAPRVEILAVTIARPEGGGTRPGLTPAVALALERAEREAFRFVAEVGGVAPSWKEVVRA